MPKKMEDHLQEFTRKVLATVMAALVITMLTSLFAGLVIVPQRVEALEAKVCQNTEDIKYLQEDTNAKITKIYELLITQKH